MSLVTKLGIGLLVVIFIFFIINLIKNRKTLKTGIITYFSQHYGPLFYIVLLLIFVLLTIYPLIQKTIDLQFSDNFRSILWKFLMILFLVYGVWIYFKIKGEGSTPEIVFKIMYAIQFLFIFGCLGANTYKKHNLIPNMLFGTANNSTINIVIWVIVWALILYFTYYFIHSKKMEGSNITTQSIFHNTIKYLGIFVLILFTSKILFTGNVTKDDSSGKRRALLFKLEHPLESLSFVCFIFIVLDMMFLIFNWSFIKWIQTVFVVISIFILILWVIFSNILKITNPKLDLKNDNSFKDGTFLNTNYIILFILFLFSFSVMFAIDPSHFMKSSLNYMYVIGFIGGLIILFSLSLVFNNDKIVELLVKNNTGSSIVRKSIIGFVFVGFLYFLILFVKNIILSIKKSQENTTQSKFAFASSTLINFSMMILICVGLYFAINKIQGSSPIFNMAAIVILCILYLSFSSNLFAIFKSHNNTKACPPNMQLWKWREFGCILFLFLGLLVLGNIKTPGNGSESAEKALNGINILSVIIFAILGFFIGGSLYNTKEKNKMKEYGTTPQNCSVFLDSKQKLTLLETLRAFIIFSIIFLVFFALNILTDKLTNLKSENDNFTYVLGLFFVFMFFIFFKFSNTSFLYLIGIFDNIFSKNYFFSQNTHKWNDLLFLISVIFTFFSSMGLIEKVALSTNIQGVKEFIQQSFNSSNQSNKSLYVDVFSKLYQFMLLIFNVIMYIPCIFNDMYEYIYNSLQEKSSSVAYILLIEFCLIMVYLIYKKIVVFVVRRETSILVNDPVWLYPIVKVSNNAVTTTSVIGKQAQGIPVNPIYNFGISFWLFIEPGISNSFMNILNFNNTPAVLYKPSMNTLIFTSQLNPENIDVEYRKKGVYTKNTLVNENIKSFTTLNNNIQEGVEKRKIVYSDSNINLQTWNNIFINYNNGIMDIFMNGNLVNSSEGNMFSEYKNEITIGDNNENIQIKICNLCFYDTNLKMDGILHVYNSSKNSNPPLNSIH